MESSEHLRSTNPKSVPFARRGTAKATMPAASERSTSPSPSFTPFPANLENKMPHHVYFQVAEWYPYAAKRNEQDKAWIRKMKWKYHDPTKIKKFQHVQEYRDRERDYHTLRRGYREEYKYDTDDDHSSHQRRSCRSSHDRSESPPSPFQCCRSSPDDRPPPRSDDMREPHSRNSNARRIAATLFKK